MVQLISLVSNIYLKLGLLLLLISSCAIQSVIDTTIPLSLEFENHSELIQLKDINWRLSDSVYNQKVGTNTIDNASTTWGEKSSKLVDTDIVSKRDTKRFFDILISDKEFIYQVEKYKVEGRKSYRFNLKQQGLIKLTSKCDLFTLGTYKKKQLEHQITTDIFGVYQKRHESPDYNKEQLNNKRLKNYLSCSIHQANQVWTLILKSNFSQNAGVRLKSKDNNTIKLTTISKQISLVDGNNGIEQRQVPPWLSHNSGLEFYKKDKQIAALSFVGKPKIWLAKDIDLQTRELLLTVNYSLLMFNWLNSEWREN